VPGESRKQQLGRLAQGFVRQLRPAAAVVDEERRQGWNVLAPISQGQEVDANPRHQFMEIVSNTTFLNGLVIVVLDRRNGADVESHRIALDDDFSAAKDASQASLHASRHLTQMLEEHGSSKGVIQPAAARDAFEPTALVVPAIHA